MITSITLPCFSAAITVLPWNAFAKALPFYVLRPVRLVEKHRIAIVHHGCGVLRCYHMAHVRCQPPGVQLRPVGGLGYGLAYTVRPYYVYHF